MQLSWNTEQALREHVARQEELLERERNLATRELDAEKARTALAEKDAAMERERAEFFKNAFESVTRGPSVGCLIVKWVFTLGLKRCV